MEKFRGYRAESISSSQLQKFFLFVMGIRFDEVVAALGESANNDFIYIPYFSGSKGRGLRAQFWDSSRFERMSWLPEEPMRVGPFEIPRKIKRVNGVAPGSIISIRKISGSGNRLSVVSRGIGANSPNFDVCVYQKVGQENSRWLGMLKDVGAKLTLEEDEQWQPNAGSFL